MPSSGCDIIMDISVPSTSKTKSTKKIKKSKAKGHAETTTSKSETKKKRKDKSMKGNLSSETNSRLKQKTSTKKKHTEEETNAFTEIKQKYPPKKKRKDKESKSSVTKSTTKLKSSKKKRQNDEGSQSSLVDFVSSTKQNGSKKKKRRVKESKSTITKPGLEEKSLKKKKQKDEENRSNITKAFTEIKQNDPPKKTIKGKESKSTVSNSEMKQKSSNKKKQIAGERKSIASNSEIEQNTSKKKKGKETVGKNSVTNAETEQSCLKKKGKHKESQTSITNFVIKLNAPKSKAGIEKASTSSLTNSEIEQNDPQKNKLKSDKIRTNVTNSGGEQNNLKGMKGKDKKASFSRATLPKSKQNVAKKRKRKSEVKPGSSKRRKKDLTALQQSQEERERREDAFLIHHPDLANHIKDHLYCEGLEGSSFTAMSAMLRECILREKWEDANRILCTMCMYQTPNVDCLWKFGSHVLQNHSSGNAELVEDLYRFVRKISISNPYQKKLEHALFLLQQNRMKEALTTLTEMWGVSQRGKLSNQQEIWKKMTSAYAGLIEYCQWHEKIKTRVGDEEEGEVVTSKGAATLQKRALVNLSKFNDDPGVWDIFITKQVQMLEAEGSIRQAEDLLTEYLSQNPGNPNAHVYLYQFLKRNHPTKKDKLKPVLKELSNLLPAEDYSLEYVDLLEKTGSADLAEVLLPMLFNMADYSTCYSNSALWETLVEHVISIVESREKTAKALLSKCWSCRKSWWTSYHFDKHGASELVKKNPDVALQKAILAAIFFGSSYPFVQKILTALQKKTPELSKDLENEIALWCNPAL